jgi:lipid-binding SYLF domain-containing protein
MGRNASASTDYKLEAEVYSYSRSKGLFAGISLSGVALAIDKNANDIFYGQQMDSNVLFTGPAKDSSPETLELKEELVDIFG